MAKTRELRVYSRHSPRAYSNGKQIPEIRLRGIWVEALGFTSQSVVVVSYENEKITLTLKKP